MKMLRLALLLPLFLSPLALAGAAGAALAAGNGSTDPHPCREDRARFCRDVEPGGGSVARCLWKHRDELSAACRKEIEEREADRHRR